MNKPFRFTLLMLSLILSFSQPTQGETLKPAQTKGTTGFWEEFHRPPETYRGPPRTGVQVYEYRCASCHERATQGAPIPGDHLEWERRAQQGMAVLMQHVRQGFNQGLMPSKGGCGNCSDQELRAAVEYMLTRSGIAPGKTGP